MKTKESFGSKAVRDKRYKPRDIYNTFIGYAITPIPGKHIKNSVDLGDDCVLSVIVLEKVFDDKMFIPIISGDKQENREVTSIVYEKDFAHCHDYFYKSPKYGLVYLDANETERKIRGAKIRILFEKKYPTGMFRTKYPNNPTEEFKLLKVFDTFIMDDYSESANSDHYLMGDIITASGLEMHSAAPNQDNADIEIDRDGKYLCRYSDLEIEDLTQTEIDRMYEYLAFQEFKRNLMDKQEK